MINEELYLNILENLQDGVYFVDKERRILFWNKGAERITGYKSDEIVGKDCASSNLNHIDEAGRPLCIVGCPLFATNIDGISRIEKVFVRHKDGHRIPLIVNIFPIKRDNEILGSVEVFTQNSPTVYEDDLIKELSGRAMYDNMTNLPNRQYMESFLEYKLSEYHRFDKKIAVLFADIDNFRTFNNEYGHEVGDLVLKNISKGISQTIKHSDFFGRWGGEEFVGVFDINKSYEATIIAERIRALVESTDVVTSEGEKLKVTISIGITVVNKQDTLESIVKRADELMYKSKKNGKNRISTDIG